MDEIFKKVNVKMSSISRCELTLLLRAALIARCAQICTKTQSHKGWANHSKAGSEI